MADTPQFIQPPTNLKSKVTYDSTGVDLSVLEQAEELLSGMQDNYLEWVQGDMERLEAAYKAAKDASDDTLEKAFSDIFEVAHDIKGQGGTFGYDLMTTVGHNLCRFLERRKPLKRSDLQTVRVHIDTMKLVLAKDMQGDGGRAGQELLGQLDALVAKLAGKED